MLGDAPQAWAVPIDAATLAQGERAVGGTGDRLYDQAFLLHLVGMAPTWRERSGGAK